MFAVGPPDPVETRSFKNICGPREGGLSAAIVGFFF